MAKKIKPLTKAELAKLVKQHPHWKPTKKGDALTLTITFHKHVDALVFLARATVHVEVLGHYPEITMTKAKLTITTTTSELKALSVRDSELITRIDHLLLTTYGESSV